MFFGHISSSYYESICCGYFFVGLKKMVRLDTTLVGTLVITLKLRLLGKYQQTTF